MKNYYEILNVQTSAKRNEIELAIDSQYNKLRQLVTHHDESIVNQANFRLQMLEKIRSVLMDDEKRSTYDAAINANMGGLTDASFNPLLTNPSLVPPTNGPAHAQTVPPRYLQPTQAPVQRVWTCPKCQTANIVNSQFCKKCGESLASPCPSCGSLVEKNSQFCTNCGANVLKAQQKKEWSRELMQCQAELTILTRNVPELDKNHPEISKLVIVSGGWAVASIIAGATYLLSGSPGHFPGINLTALTMLISGNTRYLSIGMTDIIIASAALVILSSVVIFLSIFKKTSPFNGIGAAMAAVLFMSMPKTVQSSLIMAGAEAPAATTTALIGTGLVYALLFVKIFNLIKQNFEILKPYHQRIPKSGFLGRVFAALLFAIPVLYILYPFMVENQLNEFASTYEFYAWVANAIQLFILGLLLVGYTLLNWRTSQSIDFQYRRSIHYRTDKIEKLTTQIRSLKNAIDGLDLRS